MERLLSAQEVTRHNATDDCWLVIGSQVWDVTGFAGQHPGGANAILKHAGRDATESYDAVHSRGLISKVLPDANLMGSLDISTIDAAWKNHNLHASDSKDSSLSQKSEKPHLTSIISSLDFEAVAEKTFSKKAWAFYSSAATDLISLNANRSFFDRVWFRPRILRSVKSVDTTCSVLNVKSTLPVVVAPAAMARLAHKTGEKGIAKACAKKGIIQCITINASYPIEEIISEAPNHPFFFQLYVNKDRSSSEALLQRVWSLGVRTLLLTVDAPVPGKREADEKVRSEETVSMPMSGTSSSNDKMGGGLTRTTGSYIDSTLCWDDLTWLKKHWAGRIVLKGIQSTEDALIAHEKGMDGIILSNHGGRNLDTSPPALLTLLELQRNYPDIFGQMDVYIDGGIRRGTDILKALCLGAKTVYIGRTFLYALNYGQDGVEHLINLLQDELETAMRLIGITDLSQAHPSLVNTRDLDHYVAGSVAGSVIPGSSYTTESKRLNSAKL